MSEEQKLKVENEYTVREFYADAARINEGQGVHSDRLVDELLFASVRIVELEKELKIVEEELGNLCAIDGHNDVRNGLVVGRIQHYRYRDVSPVVLINRLIELLKRLTPPAESKEAESE